MISKYSDFESVELISWSADEAATLLFVVSDGEILLIRKKRGLGAGKVNGPGGRLEAGETMMECAVRETQEELGILAHAPTLRGRHKFQFTDGYALQVFVYLSTTYDGTAIETDEAIPLWTPLDAIPFDEMWEDDEIWLPKMLAGELFDGRYLFAEDRMLGHELDHIVSTDELVPKRYR